MITVRGSAGEAKIFTDEIDDKAMEQVKLLCSQEIASGSRIRIMPDAHAGAGCTIGTTMTVTDKIVPNLVGVDIGCGMLTVKTGKANIDYEKLDNYIRENIPFGYKINELALTDFRKEIENLICFRDIPKSSKEYNRALGSLGSGNHFIEIGMDSTKNKYLIIHSGSRNLGKQVADYYQKKAVDYHSGLDTEFQRHKNELIREYTEKGNKKNINDALKKLEKRYRKKPSVPKDLCYLEGSCMKNYLNDMEIMHNYAQKNREIMAKKIIEEFLCLDYSGMENFETVHNYIDMKYMILRKGAVAAYKNQKLLIPLNMRDGSLICIGKGNEDWNYSAPHGAGRLMSRTEAKKMIKIEDFEKTMGDIYSTSVSIKTIDEAPMAYKPMENIIKNIGETVDIIDRIIPEYNFKA